MAAFGVQFHHFHDDARHPPGHGSIDAATLRRVLAFLAGQYRILPAAEWVDRASADTLGPADVCLTFDDTLRSQFDVAAPVLRDLGLTACFLVNTAVVCGGVERLELHRRFRARHFASAEAFYDAFYGEIDAGRYCHRVRQALLRYDPRTYLAGFAALTPAGRRFRFVRDDVLGPDAYNEVVDRMIADRGIDPAALAADVWMSAEHLARLHREGHLVGLHSHSHPTRMARLSPQQQREEYGANWRIVRQITGAAPLVMSHPCDSYAPYTLSILRQLGLRAGFRAAATIPPGRAPQSAYEHARQCQQMLVAGMSTPNTLAA